MSGNREDIKKEYEKNKYVMGKEELWRNTNMREVHFQEEEENGK